ncbi:MAG TPA: hypothetical protein VJU86_01480 [Pyrinomonadaceae bacterium]|nr:hypothetical protein [Pyrinomonadaceae bacterium]
MKQQELPEEIECFRDRSWNRDPELRLEHGMAAESFVDRVGFCSTLTDSRRPGPSLYIAVCGRRDAHIPRNVQKDPETRLTWNIKDELLRRGQVYYGKFKGSRAICISRSLVPHFNAMFGIPRRHESVRLSDPARKVLKVLRREWELATGDLKLASGIKERATFNKAIDELQRSFKVLPSDVVYDPKFTYIWSLAEVRFKDEFEILMDRENALKGIARAYLAGAGMTWRGELARVTGLTNPEAGIGNWGLVDEGFATRVAPGVYRLTELNRL